MPNHGYCKNCWWWKESPVLIPPHTGIVGHCYMHSQDCFLAYVTKETDYCPDYINRKKGNKDGTLDDWIEKTL